MPTKEYSQAKTILNPLEKGKENTTWCRVDEAVEDPVFGLVQLFLDDPNPNKVLLGAGVYRDGNGKSMVLESVKQAEAKMLQANLDKEYSLIDGIPQFRESALKLGYGACNNLLAEKRVASCQSIAGTGALTVGFQFLRKFFPQSYQKVYVTKPTWGSHFGIIEMAGFQVDEIRYYDKATKGLDFEGLIADLEDLPNDQIVLLQTRCHNPTGVDPTHEQWIKILDVISSKNHFIFLDSAYQGYADNSVIDDTWIVNLFSQNYERFMLSQSFSKNFGLYGERAGCLSIVCSSVKEKGIVEGQLRAIAFPQYTSPPIHGGRIVDTILRDPLLKQIWVEEVAGMAQRIRSVRVKMVTKLESLGSVHNWQHISDQTGMYAFTGLTPAMVTELTKKYSIYLPQTGRISVAGVNQKNLDYICECFHIVTEGKTI